MYIYILKKDSAYKKTELKIINIKKIYIYICIYIYYPFSWIGFNYLKGTEPPRQDNYGWGCENMHLLNRLKQNSSLLCATLCKNLLKFFKFRSTLCVSSFFI